MKKIFVLFLLMFLICTNVVFVQEYVNNDETFLLAENSIEASHKWYNRKVENDKPVIRRTTNYNSYSAPSLNHSYSSTTPVKTPTYHNTNSYKPSYSNSYNSYSRRY